MQVAEVSTFLAILCTNMLYTYLVLNFQALQATKQTCHRSKGGKRGWSYPAVSPNGKPSHSLKCILSHGLLSNIVVLHLSNSAVCLPAWNVEALLRKWLSGPGFFTGSREVKRQDILLKNLPAEQKMPSSCPFSTIKMTFPQKTTLVNYFYFLISFKLYQNIKLWFSFLQNSTRGGNEPP